MSASESEDESGDVETAPRGCSSSPVPGPAFNRTDLLAVLGAGTACAAFLALWWNRAIGLTLDGYFLLFGSKIAAGHTPYRDFFLYVPPLEPLLNALLYRAFGPALIAPRLMGVILRLLLVGVLYVWMRDFARPAVAMLAVTTGVVLASGNTTEILLLYNMDSVLWAVVAGWCLSRAISRNRRVLAWSLAAGVSVGLCLWTKQTTGLVLLFALVGTLVFLRWRRQGESRWSSLWLGLVTGFGLPTAAMVTWLSVSQAMVPAIRDTLLLGPEMKGSLLQEIPRLITNPFRDPHFALPSALGLLGAVTVAATTRMRVEKPPASTNRSRSLWWSLSTLVALGAGVLLAWQCGVRFIGFARLPQRALAYMGAGLAVLFMLRLLRSAWARGLTRCETSLLLTTVVSLSVVLALSLSWGFNEPMTVPGGVFALALFLEWALGTRTFTPWLSKAAVIACCACLALATWARLVVPYNFAGWQEPSVLAARGGLDLEAMKGFRLSASTARAVEEATSAVQRWTRPDDGLFTFPAIPIFHLLTGRPSSMFASVQWFDVCPDRILLRDLRTLERNPPAAIVELVLNEDDLRTSEIAFRDGHTSGLRRMELALHQLERSKYRRMVLIRPLTADDRPLEVWIRNDRLRAGQAKVPPPSAEMRSRSSSSKSL